MRQPAGVFRTRSSYTTVPLLPSARMAIPLDQLVQSIERTVVHEWIDAWNRRDVEAVLAMYAEDVFFTSLRCS